MRKFTNPVFLGLSLLLFIAGTTISTVVHKAAAAEPGYIHIYDAEFGNRDDSRGRPKVKAVFQRACEGKHVCFVNCTVNNLGVGDPWKFQRKSCIVEYSCNGVRQANAVAYEGNPPYGDEPDMMISCVDKE